MVRALRLVIIGISLSVLGCDSPTSPDRRTPARPVGTPWYMHFNGCDYWQPEQITTCRIRASWGDRNSTDLDVTTMAEWSSNAPDVVEIIAPGSLLARSPGEALVQVTYNGYPTSATFKVF